MEKMLTEKEMKDLRLANLYHISGDNIAFPNFKYCKPDAPYYEQKRGRWVQIDLSGLDR